MWTIIAIEGIDRIGKSTFIEKLRTELSELQNREPRVEKPTIGINTLKKIGYPLQEVPNIMEIRNIGLFEETLFQAQQHQYDDNVTIIRDRFNISELAYGMAYRRKMFSETFPFEKYPQRLYREWNNWFERELDKCAQVFLITFVLDRESYPNEDEAISAKDLVLVNEHFRMEHSKSAFSHKLLVELHKDPETGYTNIDDKFDEIMMFLNNYQWVGKQGAFFRVLKSVSSAKLNDCIVQLDNCPVKIGTETKDGKILVGECTVEKSMLYRVVENHFEVIKSFYSDSIPYNELKKKIIVYLESILIAIEDAKNTELPFPPPLEDDILPF